MNSLTMEFQSEFLIFNFTFCSLHIFRVCILFKMTVQFNYLLYVFIFSFDSDRVTSKFLYFNI